MNQVSTNVSADDLLEFETRYAINEVAEMKVRHSAEAAELSARNASEAEVSAMNDRHAAEAASMTAQHVAKGVILPS